MGAARKRQTRLAFTPVPSSSPAAQGYHKQIQDRAAIVSYDASPGPAKRRKVHYEVQDQSLGDAQLDGTINTLPTPAATSGTRSTRSKSVGEIRKHSSGRPSHDRKRHNSAGQPEQGRIDFSEARDITSFSPPITLRSSEGPRSSGGTGVFSSQRKRRQTVELSSDDDDDDNLPSPGTFAQRQPQVSRKPVRQSQRTITVESEQESEQDKVEVSAAQQNYTDSEEDMPTTQGKQPRARRLKRASSFISSSPPRVIESDDDVIVVDRPLRSHDRRDSEQEEDQPVTPGRRKLKRRRQMTQQEQEDLDDDLEFLGPSSDVEDTVRQPRDMKSVQKTARLHALAKLKQKRSSQPSAAQVPEEGASQNDDFRDSAAYDESDIDAEDEEPGIASSRQAFQRTQEDDDFIEEDPDEGLLGIPEGIPLEFTRYGSMKARELFRFAVDWMVQKKINPAFRMEDEIYDLTFKKLDDEVKGLAGSKFSSAAWTPEFTLTLNARPNIAFEPLERDFSNEMELDRCDACNRSGHPATFQVQFQGKPYHPETLEEIGAADESDSDDDDISRHSDTNEDDHPARDSKGREVAPASKVYNVGKFCMSNAQTAHALRHWRFHLNEWVVTWLISHGYNNADKIVERDRWSIKKRQKHANKIVDRMENEGVIKTLWRDFKQNIDDARNSKQGRYRGGSP